MKNFVEYERCYNEMEVNKEKMFLDTMYSFFVDKTVGINSIETGEEQSEDFRITKFVYCAGISITCVGFYYIKDAIKLCLKNPINVTNAQKNIYVAIADKYETNDKCVERAMRKAFTDSVAKNVTKNILKELKIATESDKTITLLEFISLVAFFIKNDKDKYNK